MSRSSEEELVARLQQGLHEQTREHAFLYLDPDGRIVGWRGAAEQIFGYSEDEVLGAPGRLIFTPEDIGSGLDQHELATAARDSRAEDDRWHVRKDGMRIWVTGAVTAIRGARGELLGYVKVVRDRTDLRIRVEGLENELAELRQRWLGVQQLLRTLGHEMRNPLAPLLNTANLLERGAKDEATRKKAGIIRNQVAALTRLADDLLNAVRSERGEVELQTEPVDLRELVQEQVAAFGPMASERGLRLDALLPPSPLLVVLDRNKFVQVLQNLVTNAVKYTPSGGQVWCKATREGDEVILRVEDTGIGIPPAALPRIFDLFTRGQEATQIEPGGLGVGLAISHQIVRQHGGSIQARSSGQGKGSEFSVRLPAAQAARPQP